MSKIEGACVSWSLYLNNVKVEKEKKQIFESKYLVKVTWFWLNNEHHIYNTVMLVLHKSLRASWMIESNYKFCVCPWVISCKRCLKLWRQYTFMIIRWIIALHTFLFSSHPATLYWKSWWLKLIFFVIICSCAQKDFCLYFPSWLLESYIAWGQTHFKKFGLVILIWIIAFQVIFFFFNLYGY